MATQTAHPSHVTWCFNILVLRYSLWQNAHLAQSKNNEMERGKARKKGGKNGEREGGREVGRGKEGGRENREGDKLVD